jgi:hypothetical protein
VRSACSGHDRKTPVVSATPFSAITTPPGRAYEQWAESTGKHTLTDFIRRSLEPLRVASATLD